MVLPGAFSLTAACPADRRCQGPRREFVNIFREVWGGGMSSNVSADEWMGVSVMGVRLGLDAVLPSQFYEGKHADSGERRLAFACLEEACELIAKPRADTHSRNVQARDVAVRWMQSDDVVWPFSFLNLCAHLDINPGALREALKLRPKIPARSYVIGRLRKMTLLDPAA